MAAWPVNPFKRWTIVFGAKQISENRTFLRVFIVSFKLPVFSLSLLPFFEIENVFSTVPCPVFFSFDPPDYITGSGIDAHAIEVRSKLHPFAQKNLDENVLHLFENTLVLGPHWFGPVPAEVTELLRRDAEAPLCFESTSALASHSWVSKNLSRSFPSSEVRNSPVKWADWIDKLLPRYGGHWRRAGIYDAILLSKHSINRDENLLAAALPHGRPVDAVGDYHRRKNQEKVAIPFTVSPATINQNCSFSNYLKRFSIEKDKDQQHMLFLLYWLNRFVFPNRSSAVLLEYRHLAEALHNHTAEVIAESIALAQKQQKGPGAELTSSELAFFEDAEAEHHCRSRGRGSGGAIYIRPCGSGGVPKAAGVLAAVSSPLKPPIVAMPIHSFPGSSATASFADPELEEFEAMDLDAQLDRLEKLSSPPSKAKSRAVQEAMERLKIWQSTELEFDEDKGALDQLMKDLDLLHRQNMAPKPILEMGLSLARDVLNLHDRYEDLKPTFKTSEFCKATHEANLADFARQKAELDQMVAGYKEAKATADKLEKQIEELQKQLAECREVQNRLGTGLSSKTKATFLVQSMVAASRPALEIAEASIHQGVLLQKELSVKKANLQETLGN
ncbi:autoinhibited Ca2+-ATPase 11 [Prunus dulcis]|uniref:Autoinhibited Ca2+-ATPase 11 n=1 Tax=Prunus dulcis TaxID=3755 RepID=A0A4Y1R5J7_PRUDU|nr:autoinhibited Ca2+-ATPase 11 [Prunus dulcis]